MEQSAYMSFLGLENFSARWIQKKNSNDIQAILIDCFFTSLYEKVQTKALVQDKFKLLSEKLLMFSD